MRQRLARSVAITFAIYLVTVALGVPAALLATSPIAAAVDAHPDGTAALYAPGGRFLIDAVLGANPGPALLALLVSTVLIVLVSPMLSMAWLDALRDGPRSGLLARAARQWGRALMAALYVALFATIGALLAIAGAACAIFLPLALSEPARAFCAFAFALPGLALLATSSAWLDVARAALLDRDVAVRIAVRHALYATRPRDVALHLALAGLGLALVGLVEVVGLGCDGVGIRAALVTAVGQIAALTRTFVRAAWLSVAIDRAALETTPAPANQQHAEPQQREPSEA